VNNTGVRQFRHPWGDSDTLIKAVEQFLRIPWIKHEVSQSAPSTQANQCDRCGKAIRKGNVLCPDCGRAYSNSLDADPNHDCRG
jgi:predicted amidophosphoribosyltransferase